jgi:hypothetical protein
MSGGQAWKRRNFVTEQEINCAFFNRDRFNWSSNDFICMS